MTADDDFREFVEARYTQLLGIAYLLTGSSHQAEDVLQSALVKAMRRWRRIDDPLAYVRRIMINERVSGWRRHRGRELLTPFQPDGAVADRTDDIANRQALFAPCGRCPHAPGRWSSCGTGRICPNRWSPRRWADRSGRSRAAPRAASPDCARCSTTPST